MNFIKYLKDCVGSIYVWGGQGETNITEKWIRSMETSAENAERAIAFWEKQKANGVPNLRAFDCSGLIIRYMLDEGLRKNDTTAQGLYNESTKIDVYDLHAGDLVFIHNGTKISHVGVFIGNGEVIHAQGRDVGVVRQPLNYYSNYWNRYGRLDPLRKKALEATTMSKFEVTSPYQKGDDVKAVQVMLNALGFNAGTADGVWGNNTDTAWKKFLSTYGITAAIPPTTIPLFTELFGKKYQVELKESK